MAGFAQVPGRRHHARPARRAGRVCAAGPGARAAPGVSALPGARWPLQRGGRVRCGCGARGRGPPGAGGRRPSAGWGGL